MDMESANFRPAVTGDDGEPLHQVDWFGLVARLGAERDLRRELSSRIGHAASFAAGAAWALDGSAQASPRGEPAVNLEALADRKAAQGITPANTAQARSPGIEARGQE